MNLTKQEMNLINVIRDLCFEDVLDAVAGIQNEQGNADAMVIRKLNEGDTKNAKGFRERAANLDKLQDALGRSYKAFSKHIYPEASQPGVTKMIASSPDEIIYLFEIMKKYNITCSLELNVDGCLDPMLGIVSQPVSTEYFVGGEQGDSVLVSLGEAGFGFELQNHSFSKQITECQIDISIISDSYSAWFNSAVLPPEAIKEAKGYSTKGLVYSAIGIDVRNNDIAVESLGEIINHLKQGFRIESVSDCIGDDANIYISFILPESDEQ